MRSSSVRRPITASCCSRPRAVLHERLTANGSRAVLAGSLECGMEERVFIRQDGKTDAEGVFPVPDIQAFGRAVVPVRAPSARHGRQRFMGQIDLVSFGAIVVQT